MVSSASPLNAVLPVRSVKRPRNAMIGWFSTSRKSGLRRCPSRSGSPVQMPRASISPSKRAARQCSQSSSSVPWMSLNSPRTQVTIMWRARNSASVCPGSKIHVDISGRRRSSRRRRPRPRSTSSTPLPARRSGRSDDRRRARARRRGGAASCHSSRSCRTSGTCAGAPTSRRWPGSPRSRRSPRAAASARSCRCANPSRSSAEHLDQARGVVAAAVHDAIDEEGWRPLHLTGRRCAAHIAPDALQHGIAAPVADEALEVEPKLGRIGAEILVVQRLVAVEEQLVHVPEAALQRGRLGRRGRGERVRMDVGQREVPKREAHALQPRLDPPDLVERAARVRTFVVAVLDDQRPGGRPTDMIDGFVERLEDRPLIALHTLSLLCVKTSRTLAAREVFTWPYDAAVAKPSTNAHELARAAYTLHAAVEAELHETLDELGLTMPLSDALWQLDPTLGPLSRRALAERLHCDPSNVTFLIDRLQQRRLVRRARADDDRRITVLSLTSAGIAARARLIAALAGSSLFSGLTRAEQRQLTDLLQRCTRPTA